MNKSRLILLSAGLIGLAALGACHGSEPENTVVENVTTTNVTEVTNIAEPEAPVVNAPVAANATAPAPMANANSGQVQDDADATGMTARVDRGNSE